MKFIKKIKKLTKSWAHRRRKGIFPGTQYLFWYCVPGNFLLDFGGVASWKARAHDERSDKGNTVGVATWGVRVA